MHWTTFGMYLQRLNVLLSPYIYFYDCNYFLILSYIRIWKCAKSTTTSWFLSRYILHNLPNVHGSRIYMMKNLDSLHCSKLVPFVLTSKNTILYIADFLLAQLFTKIRIISVRIFAKIDFCNSALMPLTIHAWKCV